MLCLITDMLCLMSSSTTPLWRGQGGGLGGGQGCQVGGWGTSGMSPGSVKMTFHVEMAKRRKKTVSHVRILIPLARYSFFPCR